MRAKREWQKLGTGGVGGASDEEVAEIMAENDSWDGQMADDTLGVSPLRKTVEITAGIVLVILGLIGGLIPVLQGWMFGIPGLILLARHFKWAKRILDWAKKKWAAARAGGPAGDGNA